MNKEEILALPVTDLRTKLTELGLNKNGRKKESQKRLLAHYGIQMEENKLEGLVRRQTNHLPP